MVNHPLGQGWGKTPAHLADVFEQNSALFDVIRSCHLKHKLSKMEA